MTNENYKNYLIIALFVAVSVLSYMLWGNNNNDSDTIRQLKESNIRLESRLTDALKLSDSQGKRLEASQREVDSLRTEIRSLIDSVTTIEERERGDSEIVERSLDRIEQIERIISEVGITESKIKE